MQIHAVYSQGIEISSPSDKPADAIDAHRLVDVAIISVLDAKLPERRQLRDCLEYTLDISRRGKGCIFLLLGSAYLKLDKAVFDLPKTFDRTVHVTAIHQL